MAFTDQTSLHLYETAEITHLKTWDNLVLKENEKNFMKKIRGFICRMKFVKT